MNWSKHGEITQFSAQKAVKIKDFFNFSQLLEQHPSVYSIFAAIHVYEI